MHGPSRIATAALAHYTRMERPDVERPVLPILFDATRIRLETAYRRELRRLLARTLAREGWAVVPATIVEGHAEAAPARARPGAAL